MKAQPYLSSGRDLGLEKIGGPFWKDIVVIGGCRAPRQRQCREAGSSRGKLEIIVEVSPHRIELPQPGEQVRLL
jgi:hypothetical protein